MAARVYVQFKLEGGTVIEAYTEQEWAEVKRKLDELADNEYFWAVSSRHNVAKVKAGLRVHKNPDRSRLEVLRDLISNDQGVGDGIKSYWKYTFDPPPPTAPVKQYFRDGDGIVVPMTPFHGDDIREKMKRENVEKQKLPVQPVWREERLGDDARSQASRDAHFRDEDDLPESAAALRASMSRDRDRDEDLPFYVNGAGRSRKSEAPRHQATAQAHMPGPQHQGAESFTLRVEAPPAAAQGHGDFTLRSGGQRPDSHRSSAKPRSAVRP